MYKAIICDEDRAFLQKLHLDIDWSQLDIEICGSCSDGHTAKILLKKERPDILVCSINMIGTDGLELAALAKRLNTCAQVILTSDTEDFSCAIQAIRIGIHDFLCKPVSAYVMQKSLSRVADNLRNQEQQQAQMHESERCTRTAQIQCLVFEGIRTFEEHYGLDAGKQIQNMFSQVCIISIDNFEPTTVKFTEEQKDEINTVRRPDDHF